MKILITDNNLCRNCYACVRACPVNAISFHNGKATINKQDCILCGSCVKVCSQGAKILYDDTPLVKNWLTAGEEVAAIVAPSFVASFTCLPHQLISGLKNLGFSYVYETSFGAEICAYEYQKLLAESNRRTIISTTCPSVVLLVEKHFPNLISCLAPIQSPMMITGQAAKHHHPQCKTVFIGPCISKKAESVTPYAGNHIDAVITFRQLKEWFSEEKIDLSSLPNSDWDSPGANVARLFPLAGGLLKTIGLHQDVGSLDVIEANGPIKCKSILRSISCGSLSPAIADLLCCDGCINGPQVANNELCFNKTQKVINYTNTERQGIYQYPKDFAQLYPDLDNRRSFVNKQRIKKLFSKEQIWEVLHQTGKYTEKDLLNCGACGYSTCWEKAIAVLQGKAEIQMCLPFLLKQYKDSFDSIVTLMTVSRTLEHKAATDCLTGLYNHRRFQEELNKQIEAHKLSGQTFALFMIDIDNFKQINDIFGHQTGDKVLLNLALLMQNYFKDNFVSRYGGEEFAVILPNTPPQKAFDIGRGFIDTVNNKAFHTLDCNNSVISVTVSLGISCFPINSTNRDDLLQQADYALYTAKRTKNCAVLYSTVLDEISSEEDEATISTIKTLNIVINAKDQYTFKHSERVVYYAETLARHLELPEDDIKLLRYGAFLHDIGKIKTDMSILLKSEKLTEEEYQIIKQHPVIGADIAREIPSLEQSIPVILYHHERYDGKGYPFGIKGDEIPLFGRIAAIADSFDAMTTERPYKKALTYKQAVEELKRNAGTQFDPVLVEEFLKCVKELHT